MEDISFDDLISSGSKKSSSTTPSSSSSTWALAMTEAKNTQSILSSPSPARKRSIEALSTITNTSGSSDVVGGSSVKEMKSWKINHHTFNNSGSTGSTSSTSSISNNLGTLSRIGHVMALIDDKVYIHGGETAMSNKSTLLCDLLAYTYSELGHAHEDNNKDRGQCGITGPIRAWHTFNVLQNGLALIWGGETLQSQEQGHEQTQDEMKIVYVDEPLLLDPKINMFYPPAISGTGPGGRSGHSCAAIRKDLLVYICGRKGGTCCTSVFYLDTSRMHWMRPLIEGKPPKGRCFHTSSTLIKLNSIVTFGGSDEYTCFNDVYCLQCNQKALDWKWMELEVSGDKPPPRTGHNAIVIRDRYILIFNGYNPYYYDNDNDNDNDDDDHYYEKDRTVLFYPDFYVLDCERWEWTRFIPKVCLVTLLRGGHAQPSSSSSRQPAEQPSSNPIRQPSSQPSVQLPSCTSMQSSGHHTQLHLPPLAFSSAVLVKERDDDMYDILISGGLAKNGKHSGCVYLLSIHFDPMVEYGSGIGSENDGNV